MAFGRVQSRRIGFVLVVLAGIGFELSPWGERVSNAVLDAQLLALSRWAPPPDTGGTGGTGIDAEAPESMEVREPPALRGPAPRPLSRAVVMCLIVIGALVWWESGLPGWAIGSSLAAFTALLAVSTMMLAHSVAVPIAGAAVAIVLAVSGRRALEGVIASRDRRRAEGERPCGCVRDRKIAD